MARIVKIVKTIRNNWKKSLFAAAALSYGISYGSEIYQTNLLMRAYCEEAVKYGDELLPPTKNPRHITVILNPIAKRKKAKKLFEKYCEPLLHLAGIAVTIIQTEQESQARGLIENLNNPTDAILVAGGDGTLLDVVTGLMRKYENHLSRAKQCPIGILPLGETNKLCDSIFLNTHQDLVEVRELADATMAAIHGATKLIDIVKVEPLEQDPEHPIKPIYAASSVEWGAFRDAQARIEKYWYYGKLKSYVTYVFSGFKKDVNWDINGTLRYTDPCHGCSRCYEKNESQDSSGKRWWHVFIPRTTYAQNEPDYSKIKNEKCGHFTEIPVNTTELSLVTSNIRDSVKEEGPPALKLNLGPESISYTDFIAEGWRRVKGEKTIIEKTVEAKDIELLPNTSDTNDVQHYFSIDNEEFELKPVKIKLLPKAIKVFCPQ